ncbi:MAG: GntR family transcriptional regulator [Bacteroidia bacterium]|jgi:DNA-binding GntR family transcriptional regulator
MKLTRYQEIQYMLKEKIQQGFFQIGDYLPSENELCTEFSITRTTVRKALDKLIAEGFIEKQHGKGSRVRERRNSLGLLNVKGFSEAVGQNVKTAFLQKPGIRKWNPEVAFQPSGKELQAKCLHFERLRCVGDDSVMLENNWFADLELIDLLDHEFVEGSFFKTLSQKYLIEITGSEQELRAEYANERTATFLKMETGAPILHISIKFYTSKPDLNIYSELYCNTEKYPIGNSYHL